MGNAPSTSRHEPKRKSPPLDKRNRDIEALTEENAYLRDLVTRLTELAIKNIVDDCSAPAALIIPSDLKVAKQRGPAE
jgi:hypothetical protein